MNTNFDACLALVLKEEGGYVNNPADPGGRTNLGVTQATWQAWIGSAVSEQDMRDLTQDDVKPLYRQKYWDVIRGDDLPAGVDYALLDFAVNSGPSRAIRYVQIALGVPSDGIIGPQTLTAIKAETPSDLIESVCDSRLSFLQALSTWATFGRGWSARVARVKDNANRMADS